jgi:hypothetical protein
MVSSSYSCSCYDTIGCEALAKGQTNRVTQSWNKPLFCIKLLRYFIIATKARLLQRVWMKSPVIRVQGKGQWDNYKEKRSTQSQWAVVGVELYWGGVDYVSHKSLASFYFGPAKMDNNFWKSLPFGQIGHITMEEDQLWGLGRKKW